MGKRAMLKIWSKTYRKADRVLTQYPDDVLMAIGSMPITPEGTALREGYLNLLRIPAIEYALPDGTLHLEFASVLKKKRLAAAIYYEFTDSDGCVGAYHTEPGLDSALLSLNEECLALKAGDIYSLTGDREVDDV